MAVKNSEETSKKTTKTSRPKKSAAKTTPRAAKTSAKEKTAAKPRKVTGKTRRPKTSKTAAPDFATKETLQESLASTHTGDSIAFAQTKKTSTKLTWLLAFAMLILGILSIVIATGYYLDVQARERVNEYFSQNDFRRGEAINRTLRAEGSETEVETFLTRWNPNHPVYSQVYANPFDEGQYLVEVNYLRRNGLDYEVTKAYRVVANSDQGDQVKRWAREFDLHTEFPEGEAETFVRLQDLDLPEEQRQTDEEIVALLQEQKAELERLRTAIRAGETEFEGNQIPDDFSVETVEDYLARLETELAKFEE